MVFDPVDVAEVTTAERIRSRVDRFMFVYWANEESEM